MSKQSDKRQLRNGCLIALFGATLIGLWVLAALWVDRQKYGLLVAYFTLFAFAAIGIGFTTKMRGDE